MSLIIIAFKNAPTPTAEWKTKDETLDNEIRKKTIGRDVLLRRHTMSFCCLYRNL